MRFKNYFSVPLVFFTLFSSSCKKNEVLPNQQEVLPATNINAASVKSAVTLSSQVPLKNMFGVNGFEWNFLQDPSNPSDGSKVYVPKLRDIKTFTAFRHYLDWEKIETNQGQFTFNPVFEGNWNYDVMYRQAERDTVLMLADLKTCPSWLLKSYPSNLQNPENVPAPYGLNRSDPASYILQAKAAFQLAARYGSNASPLLRPFLSVDSKPRWTDDPANVIKKGYNTLHYIECDNERDKWWLGPQAQQSAAEYAANMSAFYDGNKGKLGSGVGVKTADPNMQVVMGGLSTASVQYVRDMISWCKTNRGYRADGSIDLCFDVINYHLYSNDGSVITGKSASSGIAPELSEDGLIADNFAALSASLPNHPQVWVTEAGYDINQSSIQRAMIIGNKSAMLTQADWIIRSSLLYMRHHINRLFFYELFDDTPNGGGTYQTSGLINQDLTRRPAADYIFQLKNLMGNYTYSSTLSADPLVDKYVNGNKAMYALTIPDQKGRTGTYTLNLGSSSSAIIYSLSAGSNSMAKTTVKTSGGQVTIKVTETPVFVQGQ